MDKSLPILLISGTDDPVSHNGKEIEIMCRQMQFAGMKDVEATYVPCSRHDLLHEFENGAVTFAINDIKCWMQDIASDLAAMDDDENNIDDVYVGY